MSLRKQTIILLAILFSIIQTYAQIQTEVATTRDSVKTSTVAPLVLKAKNLTDSLINYGKLFLNTPYRYGSEGTSSFDCSGFTSHVYRNFGVNLQRSSADQAEQFPTVDKTQLKPGDLVFFNGRRRNSRVGHVGIVVAAKEDGEFDFIHASVRDGVTISNSKSDYYLKRFVKAGRVINNDSLLKMAAVNTAVKRQEYVSAVPSKPIKKVIPAKYHYVKSGETLSQIAEKHGMTVAQLKRKNNLKKDMLQLKQRLKIKDEEVIMSVEPVLASKVSKQNVDSTKIVAKNNPTGIDMPTPTVAVHTVKKGESLFVIAQLYNLSVGALKEINGLENGKIYAGQEIKLVKETDVETVANNIKSQNKQSREVKHKVGHGETLASIARKYNVSIDDLKKTNNLQDAKIIAGQELEVGKIEYADEVVSGQTINDSKSQTVTTNETTHKVAKGETLASIARKYNTTLDQLKKLNNLENGKIFAGQTIHVSVQGHTEQIAEADKSLKSNQDKTQKPNVRKITHKVRSGESLFSISKLYNISIDDIKAFNNLNSPNLQSGQSLQIPINESGAISKKTGSARMYVTHKVGSGETLSSIAVKYGCTIKQLKTWNNKSNDKLDLGEKLKVYPE